MQRKCQSKFIAPAYSSHRRDMTCKYDIQSSPVNVIDIRIGYAPPALRPDGRVIVRVSTFSRVRVSVRYNINIIPSIVLYHQCNAVFLCPTNAVILGVCLKPQSTRWEFSTQRQPQLMTGDHSRSQATAVDPHENPQQHWVPDYCILCMKTLTNAISNIINKKTYIWPYN